MNKTSTRLPRVQTAGKTHEELTLRSVPSAVMEALSEQYFQLRRKSDTSATFEGKGVYLPKQGLYYALPGGGDS